MKKTLKYVLAAATLVTSLGALASCGGSDNPSVPPSGGDTTTSTVDPVKKVYTYNTYTALSPSNWNELTYQDANDQQIMNYINSGFFTYDFKFDETTKEIVDGEFEVKFEAATKLEDVTTKFVGDERFAVPADAKAGSGYAYKITLRDDLKWDDGTPIKAKDFVYTMKQQLDPLFRNYRASSFYDGANILHGAKDYVYQGMKGWYGANTAYDTYSEELDDKLVFSLASTTENAAVQGVDEKDAAVSYLRLQLADMGVDVTVPGKTVSKVLVANFLPDLKPEAIDALEGKTFAEIKASAELNATWEKLIGWWQTEPNEELHFFITNYTFPEAKWENVGIIVGDNENELVLILDRPQQLLKEDGSLSYKAAYNMASLPLVKEDLYEANKVAPVAGSTLWTSTYNSSVKSTASWGPYKLSSFQAGKEYVLERNPYWFGYNMDDNKGKYQTDRIVCKTIKEWNTAWLAFQAGEIDSIGIDVSIANDYKHSSQALFTPSDFVGSMQLQSNKEALKGRESEGVNKTILAYQDFRKAISLGIDRKEYNNKCTTSSQPGFGLFNSMHYYDVENGGVYRNTDEAKKVLCEIYGVDVADFDNDLDEAYASITGYDPVQAKALVNKAYDAALEAGDIKATDKVVLTFGSGAETESIMRATKFLGDALIELVKGTKLEGRLSWEFENHNEKWANDFRAGAYDICTGGWSGAAWDPGFFLAAYLLPENMYSQAWDTSKVMLTHSVPTLGENGEAKEFTMSLTEWYDCLNSSPDAPYKWGAGEVDNKARLSIIAALEKEVLKVYYTVPLQNSYSAELISFKTDYITHDYNTFVSYGGIKYLTYNYDDAGWKTYCAENELDYKA